MDQSRLHAIWLRIVGALKEVVREQRITQDELHAAGDYFDRLGRSGMSRSLIDVALAMTSVEATGPSGGTRANLEGPYHATHPRRPTGCLFDHEPSANVPRLILEGQVTDASTGAVCAGVDLDVWQADSNGRYDRKGNHLRGIVTTDADGRYRLETVIPSDYSEHDFDPIGELFRAMGKTNTRAAHIHLKASLAGRELLTTQLFMPTSNFLTRDYVEGAVSEDLILALDADPEAPNTFCATFDIRVVGAEAAAEPS